MSAASKFLDRQMRGTSCSQALRDLADRIQQDMAELENLEKRQIALGLGNEPPTLLLISLIIHLERAWTAIQSLLLEVGR